MHGHVQPGTIIRVDVASSKRIVTEIPSHEPASSKRRGRLIEQISLVIGVLETCCPGVEASALGQIYCREIPAAASSASTVLGFSSPVTVKPRARSKASTAARVPAPITPSASRRP